MKIRLLRYTGFDTIRSLKPDTTTERLRLKSANPPAADELVDPPVLQSSAIVTVNQVDIGVTTLNVDEYDFEATVDGVLFDPIFIFPGRWIVDLEPAATDRTVAWEATATNSAGTATTSGSVVLPASLTAPAAFGVGDWILSEFINAPDAFTINDWTLVDVPAGPVADPPDAFVIGDWTLENFVGGEQPNPGNLTAPTNVFMEKVDDRTIRFTWGPPTTGTPTAYDVSYSQDNGVSFTTVSNVTSPYLLAVPWGGFTYIGRVAARNASGAVNSTNRTATTDMRAYGTTAEWNLPIASVLSRGAHPNEAYFRDVLWEAARGRRGPGDNLFTLFDRDYTYPVYRSGQASGQTATAAVNFGNWRSGVVPWNPSWVIPAGTDNQFIILDEATGVEYNAWQVRYDSGTNRIVPSVAGSGRVSRVTANADETGGVGDYRSKTSGFRPSRGCGIQYLGMLIRPEEVAQGKIYHALSCVMGRSGYRYYANPATKGERFPGNEADQGVPQGTRWYYDVTDAEIEAHLASLPAGVPTTMRNTLRIVFRAMRDYGLIASDQGGANHIQFQHDASTDWTPFGMDEITVGGKVYPRDALDFFPTDKSKIKFVLPPDGVLHYYERGSDNPARPPVHLSGTFEGVQRTTVGVPSVVGSTTVGFPLLLQRRAQFVGQHPMTPGTPTWFAIRSGVTTQVGTGISYTVQSADRGGQVYCRDSASNANGTTFVNSNIVPIP
jgi:hypothetical protein